jgi:uncharacterized protein
MEIILYIFTGVTTGFASGLFGIGGGAILVPLLIFIWKIPIHSAVAISLMVIVPTAIIGSAKHLYLGHGNLKLAAILALGSVVGAYFGALAADQISEVMLKRAFGGLLLLIGLQLIWSASSLS